MFDATHDKLPAGKRTGRINPPKLFNFTDVIYMKNKVDFFQSLLCVKSTLYGVIDETNYSRVD